MIADVKELLWDERNCGGKLLMLPLWPASLFVVAIFTVLDWLADATRK